MSVTPADLLARVLPCVISGGRPSLRERPVHKFLHSLHNVTADPVWVVRDDDAAGYQRDDHEVAAYERGWAEEYARQHWTDVRPMTPGGFLGPFPGREFACRLAEERGCWAVLQLDDNIDELALWKLSATTVRIARQQGGLALFADTLAAVLLSTSAAMAGAQLTAVSSPQDLRHFTRAGYPYSLFAERTRPGRPPWLGPSEDDILHALQYATSAAPVTAAVVLPLRYKKERASTTGLRAWYDHDRSAGLQRMFPEAAQITVKTSHANGQGTGRVFHTMRPLGRYAPLTIADRPLYEAARERIAAIARDCAADVRAANLAKAERRAARARSLPAVH